MVLAGCFEDERIGATGDEAIRIDGIPRGNEDVDFVGMSQEGAYGLVVTRQVEKGFGLFGAERKTKKDDRGYDEESAFHRTRSLPAFNRDVQRAMSIGDNHSIAENEMGTSNQLMPLRRCRHSGQLQLHWDYGEPQSEVK